MNNLLSVSTICQSLPKEFLMTYTNALMSDEDLFRLYTIRNIAERSLDRPKMTPVFLKMIEIFFQRKNIRHSVCRQIHAKINAIEQNGKA